MADDPPKRLPVDAKQTTAELQRRKRLFDALSVFIRKHGGWLTSAPHERWLRVEVPENSTLPAQLYELGYDPQRDGTNTRVTPEGFTPVNVFVFAIPPGK